MAGIDHLYQFLMNLSTKMVSDGNARYCIPDARFETSFQHIFQHWFNLFQGNFRAWNAMKSIFYEFKYKWHLMKTVDNRFQMWGVRCEIVSGIELVYARAMYSTGNAKKWPFMPILYGINEFNAGNYADNISHISHLLCNIWYFHQVPFVLKYIRNPYKWSFFAFLVL